MCLQTAGMSDIIYLDTACRNESLTAQMKSLNYLSGYHGDPESSIHMYENMQIIMSRTFWM